MSDAELIRQISPLLSETTQVKTATASGRRGQRGTQDGLNFIKYFLLGFGGIALFVGSFVIANTLAITVAQRMRELATLRTLGASRRQVLGSVVLESVVVGLVGSIIGLFLGLGIAVGLTALLEATGVDLPSSGLVFSMRTIVVSLGVGTLISLLASLRPAVRATRVEPIAAVREGAVMPASRFARYALATSAHRRRSCDRRSSPTASSQSGLEIKVRIVSLVVGVLLMFVGVAMIASRVVRPLAYVLGAPGARFGGTAGKPRPPERGPEPGANGLHGRRGDDRPRADHVRRGHRPGLQDLVHGRGQRAVRRRLLRVGRQQRRAAHEQGRPGRREGARRRGSVRDPLRRGQGRRQDRPRHRCRREPDEGRRHRSGRAARAASPRSSARTAPSSLKRYADDHSLTVGSPLTVKTPTGKTLRLHVDGIVDPPKGGSPFGEISVSTATFDGSFANHDNDLTFLNIQRRARPTRTLRRSRRASRRSRPPWSRRATSSRRRRTGDITQTLQILYALLGLSVIVSLFGVINTLVLSVFERTRELGMLRAIGMTRRQVRRMIRHESVVTALIGAALGIAVGMFLAVLTTAALSQYGIVFAVPYGTLVVFVGVAILAGMLAAILPARRASKLNILEALQYE